MIFSDATCGKRRNVGEQVFSLNRKEDSLVKAIFVYGNDVASSYSTRSLIPSKEFASIQTLRQEVSEIRRNSVKGYDQEGNRYDPDAYMICTFHISEMEAFICKEGVYRWAQDKEDFEDVGVIDKVVANKTVTFMERTKIEVDAFSLQFEKNNCFYLDGEYITYDSEGKPIRMLVVQNEFTNPIAIPFNEEFMVISSRDLITIR